jgi:hypothetical protein
MNETDYRSPWPLFEDEWDVLTSPEKALVLNYGRRLLRGEEVRPALIYAINAIHEKYPAFHMGCIPNDLNLSKKELSEGA